MRRLDVTRGTTEMIAYERGGVDDIIFWSRLRPWRGMGNNRRRPASIVIKACPIEKCRVAGNGQHFPGYNGYCQRAAYLMKRLILGRTT